jgi:RNA polymerase sigma-70 factor (ECF subfamily)
MRLVHAGDTEAIGALYERYSKLVRVTGLRILRDESEAQELVQDVFLYLHQKNRLFDGHKSKLRSWLMQVTYSRAFDRRDYLLARRFYDYVQIEELVEAVESTLSLESHVEDVGLRSALQRAFSELSERQRLTLSMFFVEGYSLREISCHLDETLANTRHHYYRGLENLRTTLKGTLVSSKSRVV